MQKLMRMFAATLMSCALVAPAMAQSDGGEGPGTPPTAQQVVERCVGHIREITERGVNGLRETTMGAVQLIGRLDEQGAPDKAILRAAHEGRERVVRIARAATRAINQETGMCLRVLRHIEAPQGAIDAVLHARRAALGVLGAATQRSLGAIRDAVQGAVEGPGATSAGAAAVES